MTSSRDRVAVHLDAAELGAGVVGWLTRERRGAKSVISFEYDRAWVRSDDAFPIDPALPLFEGEQYLSGLPGALADAAPDRWGRTLLERREAIEARREGRSPCQLDEWDFLLGVGDLTRMGALRLSREGEAFLADRPLTVPPLARLRELEGWAAELERGLGQEMGEEDRWIAMLVAPGSSLGGARPKANFEDDGLWIAKFPSREDRHDVGAWEYVVSRLAGAAGIVVPTTRLLELGSPFRTFCARRFDRTGGERRMFASAMTLAGRVDHERASYLDIARAIVEHGDPVAIEEDLRQLFRRLIFNVTVGNRDDHLRNHGFLRQRGGWRLAPAFDVNPDPAKLEHSLALDDATHESDLGLVRETAPYYRLSATEAGETIAEVRQAVSRWRDVARETRLPREEIDLMGTVIASA